MSSVHSFSQLPRTVKGHNPSRSQHHVTTGSRVSPSPFLLLLYTKLPEPTDQDILTGNQGLLDEFKQGLHQLDCLLLGEANFFGNGFDDVILGEIHVVAF